MSSFLVVCRHSCRSDSVAGIIMVTVGEEHNFHNQSIYPSSVGKLEGTFDHWWFLTATASFILLLGLLYRKGIWNSKLRKLARKIIGPKGLPFIGNAFELAVPSHEILGVVKGWIKTFGPVVQGWLGNQVYIFVTDSGVAEKILTSNIQIEKSSEYNFLHSWLGFGLLTSKGQKWHERRKLLTPAFHYQILDHFIEIFNEQSSILIEILGSTRGKTIDVYPYITKCALDIICETAMGERINAQRKDDSEYVKAVYEMTNLILQRMTNPLLRIGFIHNLLHGRRETRLLKILHGFTDRVIQHRKEERNNRNANNPEVGSKKRRLAFLDLLLEASENGKVLSDLDIREETDTFLFEGHDTSAASISWTILLLAANPECQMKLREELADIFGSDKERQVTLADVAGMRYLDCCVKESLRLYPIVPFFGRKLRDNLDIGKGRIAPKDSIVFIVAFLIHRNPQVFPDPESFRPDRFFPENSSWKQPFNYLPFSGGARNCIGQKFALLEEKVVLANIFRNFQVRTEERLEDMRLVPQIILRPKDGIRVELIGLED